eukprot:11672392-Alexandrium_andersonii.AAC.1
MARQLQPRRLAHSGLRFGQAHRGARRRCRPCAVLVGGQAHGLRSAPDAPGAQAPLPPARQSGGDRNHGCLQGCHGHGVGWPRR